MTEVYSVISVLSVLSVSSTTRRQRGVQLIYIILFYNLFTKIDLLNFAKNLLVVIYCIQ
jgi:hypothetical protein